MFVCPLDDFVDDLALHAVIPGLSVRIGRAAVLAALLNAVTEGAVMLLSCFHKTCSFSVQRPR